MEGKRRDKYFEITLTYHFPLPQGERAEGERKITICHAELGSASNKLNSKAVFGGRNPENHPLVLYRRGSEWEKISSLIRGD